MKIGILGGGQLARMLSLAATNLGLSSLCYSQVQDSCASDVCRTMHANFSDINALQNFMAEVEVVTYESENIPSNTTDYIEQLHRLAPANQALVVSQDRLTEKRFFRKLDIPTTDFVEINQLSDLHRAVEQLGLPTVLKTRRFGYDGKGQFLIESADDIASAWETLQSQELIAEQYIEFDREISIIAVRGHDGEILCYPLTENTHKEGILLISKAPFTDETLSSVACKVAKKLMSQLKYIGTMAVEFFQVGDRLLASEFAPRVHNSGHWTIEGAQTSQFENHIRAIYHLPLGSVTAKGHSIMINCIGQMPALAEVLACPNAHYYNYNKEARPHRKLGHITLNANTQAEVEQAYNWLLKHVPLLREGIH
jgi:5-(carboxyamino)imidazole ribonucleotide synthase